MNTSWCGRERLSLLVGLPEGVGIEIGLECGVLVNEEVVETVKCNLSD